MSILFSSQLWANECNVIVYTDSETLEKSFNAPKYSEGHKVPEMSLSGKANEVIVMADAKWLGISWHQSGQLIAESVTLIRDIVSMPRALIIYNPKNTDEQVSLDCEK